MAATRGIPGPAAGAGLAAGARDRRRDGGPLRARAARIEAPLWRLASVRPERETGWLRYALGLLVFNALGCARGVRAAAPAGDAPAEPAGLWCAVAPDSAFNTAISFMSNTNWQGYGGETTMGYPHTDARPDGAELPLGRHRHRGGGRAGARLRAPLGPGHRQRLGGPHAGHAVGAAAAVAGAGAVLRRPGCDPELLAVHRCEDPGDRELGNQHLGGRRTTRADRSAHQPHTDPGHGAGGLAAGHQDGGHQRRRLLQRQLGPSVREPHTAVQLRADAQHLPDPGRAVFRVRPHGG